MTRRHCLNGCKTDGDFDTLLALIDAADMTQTLNEAEDMSRFLHPLMRYLTFGLQHWTPTLDSSGGIG